MISVIVPCYNSEKYIDRCIESLLRQEHSELEIILIDDGSTDRTGIMCDEWRKKDNRIRVIHQINQGVSVARNVGIESARGEFICFVDSDDWVDKNYVSSMYETFTERNVDLAISGKQLHRKNGDNELFIPQSNFYEGEAIRSFFFDASLKDLRGGPVCKLYKTEIIRSNNLKFIESIHYLEDAIFVLQYLLQCNSFSTIASCGYHYELHSNSLVFTVHSFENEQFAYKKFKEVALQCRERYNLKGDEDRWLTDNLLFLIQRKLLHQNGIHIFFRGNRYLIKLIGGSIVKILEKIITHLFWGHYIIILLYLE